MKKFDFYAEYDTDGYVDLYKTERGKPVPSSWACQLGPYKTFAEAKRNLIWALKDCRREIDNGIFNARKFKSNCTEEK